MDKIYKSNIDLRILSDKIDFLFYVSGSVPRGGQYNKNKSLKLTFDTTVLAQVIYQHKDGQERMFLKFPKKGIKIKQYINLFTTQTTDIILEVFKTSKGFFGFEKLSFQGWGAYLSHRKYFNTLTKRNAPTGTGAIHPINALNKSGYVHQLQMILPALKIMNHHNISFDIDILIEKGGQFTNSLTFKNNLEEVKVIEGNTLDIKPATQIITATDIKLDTTYIKLQQKDLASRELVYDYKQQLTPQNVEANSLELIDSQVYAVENPLKVNVDLTDLNLSDQHQIEIPYNISRIVEDNKVLPTLKTMSKGKEIYELNWSSELIDNTIIKTANKCMSLKFSTPEQLNSFEQNLKKQQMGLLEKYPILDSNGRINYVKRTYSSISQWIERSRLNQFNDTSFVYNIDGNIDTILICPNKKTNINNNIADSHNEYTEGNEYLTPSGNEYIGYYHIHNCEAMVGKKHTDLPHDALRPLYNYAPISANSKTDFLFTTFDKTTRLYSAFTATTNSMYKFSDTYDVHISGSSYSAKTTVPISNVSRNKKIPLIDDPSKLYGPYVFSEAYAKNGGDIIIDETDPTNYLRVSAVTAGIYRFTYKSYINIKYKDTQWCEYITNSFSSGITPNYPQSNFEIKRLINTSIIQAGYNETNTALQDTGFKFYPGRKFKDGKGNYNVPENTGILDFKFNVSLIKTTTGGTQSTLKRYTLKRSKLDGTASGYLTLDVTNSDKTSSGSNVCVLSAVSSSTIFSKELPINLDTGLIHIMSGDTVHVEYDSSWNTTSKGGFFGLSGGETDIDINLGHKLDENYNVKEAPWFRGVKSTQNVVSNNLFFDQSKTSKPFKMVIGKVERDVKLEGSLYLTGKNDKCGNMITPSVSSTSFKQLSFVDTQPKNEKLIWDVKSNRPTNKWQKMIESNKIKDYTLTQTPQCPLNICPLTKMKDNGVFCFYLPTYSDEEAPTCDFTFPQVSQSYIIINRFRNPFGKALTHYIVVTPDCSFYKPCSGSKPIKSYNILEKTRLDDRSVVSECKKLTIKGKEIKIIDSRSHYNPAPTIIPIYNKCRYYCQCPETLSDNEGLGIDSIYGTTNIFTDTETENCANCLDKANTYCKNLNENCKAYLIDKCKSNNDYIITEEGTPAIKNKGVIRTNIFYPSVGGPPIYSHAPTTSINSPESHPGAPAGTVINSYTCIDGVCLQSPSGEYPSLTTCLANCTASPVPPPHSGSRPSGDDSDDDGGIDIPPVDGGGEGGKGICSDGQYWCEIAGSCISNEIPCEK